MSDELSYWENGKKFAGTVGDYSSLFTVTVRSLFENKGQLSPTGKFLIMRIIRSPSMVARFYYLNLSLYPQSIEGRKSISPLDLALTHPPQHIAAIFSVIYLHSRLKSQVEQKYWLELEEALQRQADLGLLLGRAIPDIGPAVGLLTGVSRFFAWCTFAVSNCDSIKEYRGSLKSNKIPCDIELEFRQWKTAYHYVYSIMLLSLGFGKDFANSYFDSVAENDDSKLNLQATKFRVASIWLDHLMMHGEPPETDLGDDFILADNAEEHLFEAVDHIRSFGSKHSWLKKNRDDISPELTPELTEKCFARRIWKKGQQEPSQSNDDEFDYSQLAPEIRNNFSKVDLWELMDEIKELLEQ